MLNGAEGSAEKPALPSAAELAEVHGSDYLRHLRGLAYSLGDTPARELLEEAIVQAKRKELDEGLGKPALVRHYQQQYAEQLIGLQAQAQAAAQPRTVLFTQPEAAHAASETAERPSEPLGDAQSADLGE